MMPFAMPTAAQLRIIGKVVGLLLVVLAIWALYSWVWNRGADHVQAKWDAEKQAQATAAAETNKKRAEVAPIVVTQYVDRVRVVHQKGDTIIKEVPVYVPADAPDLPGGFRLLHDAAAANTIPDPAGAADARPAAAQAVAATVADNYKTCHATAEQLIALQDWIRRQEAINDHATGP